MMDKLAIVCVHLNEDKSLEFEMDKMEPVNEKDSGYLLVCKQFEHRKNIDDWVTSHVSHFVKE